MMKHLRIVVGGAALAVVAGLVVRSVKTPAEVPLDDPLPAVEEVSGNASAAEGTVQEGLKPDVDWPKYEDAVELGARGPVDIEVTPLGGADGGRTVKVLTPNFSVANVPGHGQAIKLPDGTGNHTEGGPEIDGIVRIIDGRNGYLPRVTVHHTEFDDHGDFDLAPREGYTHDDEAGWRLDRRPDPAIYGTDAHWPPELVDVQQFKIDGETKVRLEYRPVQYNPVTRVLRHHRSIESEVTFEKIDFDKIREEKIRVKAASSATEVTDNCDCAERITLERDILPTPLTAGDFQRRWSGEASAACIKLSIRAQGVYRVRQSDLSAKFGVGAGDFANARLYTRDREVPILMQGSSFLFYGEGVRSLHTDENAYFIGFGGPGAPARMQASNPANYRAVGSTISGAAGTVQSACERISAHPMTKWEDLQKDYDDDWDGWAAGLATDSIHGSLSQNLVFPGVSSPRSGGTASLKVFMRGRNRTVIIVNTPNFTVSRPSGVSGFVQYNPDLFGDYYASGSFNGRTQYRRSTDGGFTLGSETMRYNGSGWDVVDSAGRGWRSTPGATPPIATWTVPLGGASPANGIRVTAGVIRRTQNRDHHWRARNNSSNQILGNLQFGVGESKLVTAMNGASPTFSSLLLTPGTTTVRVEGNTAANLPANTSGYNYQAVVDFGVLDYERNLVGVGNRLGFGGLASRRNYVVSSISTSGEPYLFDISDPTNPVWLDFTSTQSGNTVRFGYDAGPTEPCFFLSSAGAVATVSQADMDRAEIRNLADIRRQTDYIVIIPEAFEGPVPYSLLDYRAQARHGQPRLNVLVATVESIYDEFGYGVRDPAAIKQFLGFAYHHFQEPKPQFVLLAGDGTYDPDHRSGFVPGSFIDYIPAKFADTSHAYTSIDQWYVSVDGVREKRGEIVLDDLADMAIGRMPANNTSALQTMINKVWTYETYSAFGGFRSKGALVADDPDETTFPYDPSQPGCTISEYPSRCQPFNFISDELFNLLPQSAGNKAKLHVHTGNGNAVQIRDQILSISGSSGFGDVGFINYIGHGSRDLWTQNPTGTSIFRGSDAAKLSNTALPLVTVFTCSNGIFFTPEKGNSCAETLLVPNIPTAGAAGVIAPSGFAATRASRRMALDFYNAMMNDQMAIGECKQNYQSVPGHPQPRVGQCLLNCFRAVCYDLGHQEELRFYNFFGDPAMLHKF